MMSLVGFVLECAAIAALAGSLGGVLVQGCALALRPLLARLGAGLRGDLWLLLGLLPALAALSMVAAAAAPSVGSVLGLTHDHCPGHGHHFHVCFIHSTDLRPALATIGAFALTVWCYRTVALIAGAVRTRATARMLEGLARLRGKAFPVFIVPAARLCHAMGLVRRRIMLSAELAEQLSPIELDSALAHEEAHLRRQDPLAGFLLAAAALFVPPPIGAWFRRRHHQASEEACDEAAAKAVGDGALVAGALVKVAALQRTSAGTTIAAPAFGADALEIRVKALLERERTAWTGSRWGLMVLSVVALFAGLAFLGAESLHHAAETILGHIF